MKKPLLLLLALGSALAVSIVAATRMSPSTSAASTPTPSTGDSITVSAPPSDDGLEMFTVRVFRPWAGAEQRVVEIQATFVGADGLPGVAYKRTSESSLPNASPLSVRTERSQFTATPRVGSWNQVMRDADLRLDVTSVQ
jgi:hypothetical protein